MPRPRKKVIEESTSESVPVASASKQEVTRTRGRRMSTPAFVGVFFLMTLIVVGSAILVGRSDRGQIDVNAAINSANQANRELYGENAVQVNTVREDLRDLPNGGLVPQENQPADPPPQPPADTASTTDPNATTTPEAGADADGEEANTEDEAQNGEETPTDQTTDNTTEQNGGQ